MASTFRFRQVEVIESWSPLFLFSVLFGLSTDYHVFLLSTIKEQSNRPGPGIDEAPGTVELVLPGVAVLGPDVSIEGSVREDPLPEPAAA